MNNTNLTWLILLSLGLHALVITAWQWDKHVEVSTESSSGALLLAINATPAPVTKNVEHNNPTNKTTKPVAAKKPVSKTTKRVTNTPASKTINRLPHKKTDSKPHALPEKHEPRSAESKSAPERHHPLIAAVQKHATAETTSPDNAAGNQQNAQQVINERIQEQLNIRIAFNHHYPSMAIRNAWEGRVNLGIRVLASGKLTNIHVVDSSGYSILDKAALTSVVRVSALPQARQWLRGRDIDVILPIIYKLTDS